MARMHEGTIATRFQHAPTEARMKDKDGRLIYERFHDGYWCTYAYDNNDKCIFYNDSKGEWNRKKYDNDGKCIYSENVNGFIINVEYQDFKDIGSIIKEYKDNKNRWYNKIVSKQLIN